jgi:hypothetical protein
MAAQPKTLEDGSYGPVEYQEFEVTESEFEHWHNEWLKRVELYYLSN